MSAGNLRDDSGPQSAEVSQKRSPGRKPDASGLRPTARPDERLADEREYDEREVADDHEMTDDERFEMFAQSQFQSVLPDLPPMPGFHTMWLTTNNARDSIPNRLRMGYQLIKLEDCPGWEGVSLQAGDYAGVIAVNEMVAARIPLRLYQRYMRHAHHTLPLQEEEKLHTQQQDFMEQAASSGAPVREIGDGSAQLVQRAKVEPTFVERQ
jgi:hypothetical protein